MSNPIKLSSPATHEFWEIPVRFEDEHLLALDKPAGLLLAPDRYDPHRAEPPPPDLLGILHAGIAADKPWAVERQLDYLMNVHWLDRDASGVVLFAKSKLVLVALADSFGAGQPQLHQLALVQGSPREDQFTVNAKLAPHPLQAGLWRVDPERGKKSSTRFTVVERFARHTLVDCVPSTDRPHQILVHLQNSGLRVVGDERYGGPLLLLSELKRDYRLKPGRTERPLLSRPALHAEKLELPHPVTAAPLCLTAPWPKDLRVAVKYLRQYGSTFGNAPA